MQDGELNVATHAVTVRSLVAEKLRTAIVRGHFRPGQQLRERELCDLTGVSRPSLREVLRQLEAEGLITTVKHHGPMVASFTVDQVDQIYTMRRLLETFATGEFARLRRPKPLQELRKVAAGLDAAQSSGDPLVMMSAGTAFYQTVAVGGANAYVQDALLKIHTRLSLIRYLSLHQRARVAQSFDAIRAICDAILAGDKERAEHLCTLHLDAAARTARSIVEAGYTVPAEERATAA